MRFKNFIKIFKIDIIDIIDKSQFIFISVILLLILLFHSPLYSQSQDPPINVAIIIGIDEYKYNSENIDNYPIDNLSYAVYDATKLAETLKEGYEFQNPILITNEEATRQNILWELDMLYEYIKDGGKVDKVLFYTASHGINLDNKNYILPYDSNLTDNTNLIELETEIFERLDNIKKEGKTQVVSFFDACRTTTESDEYTNSWSRETTKYPDLNIMFASQNGKPAYESERYGGYFTHSLVEGLKESADSAFFEGNQDYFITFEELGYYVESAMKNIMYSGQSPDIHYSKSSKDIIICSYTKTEINFISIPQPADIKPMGEKAELTLLWESNMKAKSIYIINGKGIIEQKEATSMDKKKFKGIVEIPAEMFKSDKEFVYRIEVGIKGLYNDKEKYERYNLSLLKLYKSINTQYEADISSQYANLKTHLSDSDYEMVYRSCKNVLILIKDYENIISDIKSEKEIITNVQNTSELISKEALPNIYNQNYSQALESYKKALNRLEEIDDIIKSLSKRGKHRLESLIKFQLKRLKNTVNALEMINTAEKEEKHKNYKRASILYNKAKNTITKSPTVTDLIPLYILDESIDKYESMLLSKNYIKLGLGMATNITPLHKDGEGIANVAILAWNFKYLYRFTKYLGMGVGLNIFNTVIYLNYSPINTYGKPLSYEVYIQGGAIYTIISENLGLQLSIGGIVYIEDTVGVNLEIGSWAGLIKSENHAIPWNIYFNTGILFNF
ncbi:MAG: caspase family protein [Spirochaetota bacterium]